MNNERQTAAEAEQPWDTRDERAVILLDLLSEHHERRREALREARARRWIDSYGDIRVRAILTTTTRVRSHEEFAHALKRTGRGHTMVLRDAMGIIIVTSERRAGSPIDPWVRTQAPKGLHITAIGSASLRADEDDLMRAVEDARTTARIAEQLGEELPTHRAEDLGAWRLLHAIEGGPELVMTSSPAAHALWHSDAVRRETIEVYLDSGCNVKIACERLHIHRTTLYYRLENMPDVVHDALTDGLKRSTLHIALKLLRLWNCPATTSTTSRTVDPAAEVRELQLSMPGAL